VVLLGSIYPTGIGRNLLKGILLVGKRVFAVPLVIGTFHDIEGSFPPWMRGVVQGEGNLNGNIAGKHPITRRFKALE
jgi:hypothetical protein